MQRLLQSHPAICGGEESHFFTLLAHAMTEADVMAAGEHRSVGPLAYVTREKYDEIFLDVWNALFAQTYAEHPNALVHLEKTPFHALCLNQIHRLFPDAKIVHLVRDSRAVSSSLMAAASGDNWGKRWAASTPKAAAMDWYRHVSAVQRFEKAHPDHPILTVRYEDALTDTRGVLDRILQFLLPGDQTADVDQVMSAFNARQAGKNDPKGFSRMRGSQGWKADLNLWSKFVIWRYTRKKMREFGYEITLTE